MILNTAETEMGEFEPQFNFKLTFDDDGKIIYLWLNSVTPYRLSWFDLSVSQTSSFQPHFPLNLICSLG